MTHAPTPLAPTTSLHSHNFRALAPGPSLIVLGAFWVTDGERVALSVLGAVVLNLTLAINHRPGRYMAM